MTSFVPGLIECQPIPQRLLQAIRLLGEFKGKQTLFNEQSPQLLEALRQTAIIQSTESSNRIEGIVAPLGRIEQVVERTRESYYETLYLSSRGWHQAEHSLLPWTEYLLGVAVLMSAYRDFERRVGMLTTARGAKQECVRDMIGRLFGEFTTADLERACPGVSRATIRLVLADLKKQKQIRLVKRGPDARWEKLT